MYKNIELMGVYWNSILTKRYGFASKIDAIITEKVAGSYRIISDKEIAVLPVVNGESDVAVPVEAGVREFLCKNSILLRNSFCTPVKVYGVAVIYDSFLGRFYLKVDGKLLSSLEGVELWNRVLQEQAERFIREANQFGVGFFKSTPMYVDFVMTPAYSYGTVDGVVGKVYRSDHREVFMQVRMLFERFGVKEPKSELYFLTGDRFIPVSSESIKYDVRENYYFGGEGWEFFANK